jgi:hypothetical protein
MRLRSNKDAMLSCGGIPVSSGRPSRPPSACRQWRYDEDFQGLIGSLFRALPLRSPSELGEGALKRIVEATGGITSAIFRLITDLAVEAIGSGAERITAPAILNRRIASPAPEAVL